MTPAEAHWVVDRAYEILRDEMQYANRADPQRTVVLEGMARLRKCLEGMPALTRPECLAVQDVFREARREIAARPMPLQFWMRPEKQKEERELEVARRQVARDVLRDSWRKIIAWYRATR